MQQSQLPPPLARVLEPSTGRACRLLPPPPRLGHGFHEKHTEIRFSFASLFLGGYKPSFRPYPNGFPPFILASALTLVRCRKPRWCPHASPTSAVASCVFAHSTLPPSPCPHHR